jgi:hypothetical protein
MVMVKGTRLNLPPDCLIDIAKARPVVSGDNELEGRLVGEEILTHEPSGDGVAAGQGLDL